MGTLVVESDSGTSARRRLDVEPDRGTPARSALAGQPLHEEISSWDPSSSSLIPAPLPETGSVARVIEAHLPETGSVARVSQAPLSEKGWTTRPGEWGHGGCIGNAQGRHRRCLGNAQGRQGDPALGGSERGNSVALPCSSPAPRLRRGGISAPLRTRCARAHRCSDPSGPARMPALRSAARWRSRVRASELTRWVQSRPWVGAARGTGMGTHVSRCALDWCERAIGVVP